LGFVALKIHRSTSTLRSCYLFGVSRSEAILQESYRVQARLNVGNFRRRAAGDYRPDGVWPEAASFPICPNSYQGIDQYLRLMESIPLFWFNHEY
jgi:hypothetical protein